MESRIHGSKLSAAVPAFIPGATYTGVTSARLSNDLVINSDLSPLVPEFQPSGSCSFPLSTPHQPIHSLQYRTKQVYLKHEKIDLQENAPQVYQTTFLASKRFTAKIEKPATAKKGKRTCEAQNVSENTTSEQSAEISVNVSKKKRQRKKKESRDLIQQQGKEEKESHQSKDVSSSKEFDASLKANEVSKSKSSQSSCITLPSSSETSSGITGDKRTDITVIEHDQQPDKTQFAAPTFTVSYSDKVKSLSLKNSNTSNHTVTEKYWVKDFTSERSIKRDTGKPNDLKQSPKVCLVQNRRTLNLDNNQRTSEKSGHCGDAIRKPPDSTWKKTWEDSEYYKLKSGDSFKSQTTSSKQIARTGKQMGRNSSFKKISCDDDDNWRVKKEDAHVVDSATSHRTEPIEKLNIKNLNDESFEKKTCQQEGILVGVDSKQYKTDVKQEKIGGRNVVDDKVETLRKQKNYCDLSSSLAEQTACTGFPVNKLGSDLPSSSQDHKANQILNASNVAASDHKIMNGEFPDLKESVKMKRPPSATEERTINYKEMVTSPKPSAPMSYSAALRSAPQPKPVVVSPAWENEQPTTHGGLLKVPSQAMAREVENEAGQGESTPKKKKKKKKKKKTSETGEQTQESGSSKRTQKPIQFDLGVMLQAISKSSSERGKKLVIATGVLPTQLSVISSTDVKHGVNNPQLKKGESKVPHNKLDSTAPVIKRGKERETPARKKPSALKKIILKEREEKKKAKETSETDDVDDDTCDGQENRTCESEGEMIAHQEVQSQSEDETADPEPLSPTDREIAAEIHSRRFREYCFQIPDKEVDTVATELLRELVRFQDRQFHKDPVKAKAKRRFVLGLREVNKHLKLRKLKCVIISSNVERIKSAGGLDDTLDNIISLCQENLVPVVFALKRQLLGKVLLKKVPVSIVGIFNYDGAQEHFKTLMELTQKTKQAYTDKWQETREKLELQQKETSDVIRNEMEMVSSAEINQADDIPQTMGGDAGTENYFADDAESSDDDDDDDGNNEESIDSDRYNEKETIMIVENDLEIQDL